MAGRSSRTTIGRFRNSISRSNSATTSSVSFSEVTGLETRDQADRIPARQQPDLLADQDAGAGQRRQRDDAQGHLRQGQRASGTGSTRSR